MTDTPGIPEVLSLLSEAERAIADLYEACARAWPEESLFWSELVAEERGHAAMLERMSSIVTAAPQRFTLTRIIPAAEVKLFIQRIRDTIWAVMDGRMSHTRIVEECREIENSMVEVRGVEAIEGDDPDLRALARDIVEQSLNHRSLFQQRMDDYARIKT